MAKQSSEAVEAGTVLAGRYRVVRQLGKGGMGSVYLVQHLHTEQQLALKLLHDAVVTDEIALTRFRREARAPARVNSDHVVQVTDADVAPELGGVPFLVMEWLRGQSLEEISAERGPLPAEEVVLYLRQTARALDKAHPLGVVHRDLKPDNLFLTTREDGTPCLKILDFGIAKLAETGEEGARLKATGTGQIFGTPLYMSPEQTRAEVEKVSGQSDLWALGIIAHRLLTGVEPWSAPTLTALISQIVFEPLPVPSAHGHDLGPAFDAWFARCCAREPVDRFPTAGEAVAELARALGVVDDAPAISRSTPGSRPSAIVRPSRDEIDRTAFSATARAPIAVPATTDPATAPEGRRSSRAPLIVGAGVVVGIAIVAAIYASGRPSPPAVAVAPPDATTARPAAASATAVAIVTPGTAAPEAIAPPSASAVAASPPDVKRPLGPHAPKTAAPAPTVAPAAPTVAPTVAPVAPVPTPAVPDDPLRGRH